MLNVKNLKSRQFSDYDTASKAVRQSLGVNRLTPTIAKAVRDAVAKHTKRQEAGIAAYQEKIASRCTVMDRLGERLKLAVEAGLEEIADRVFRHPSGRWAGGDTIMNAKISREPKTSSDIYSERSSNGKWIGNSVSHLIHVQPAWRSKIRNSGIAELDGMLTTHAEPLNSVDDIEVYAASWVRQGRGLSLVAESGVIAYHRVSATAYHAEGGTAKSAVIAIKRKMKLQAIPYEERRAKNQARAEQRAEKKRQAVAGFVARLARHDFSEIADVEITVEDSLRAGNCRAGTLSFAERFLPDRDHATIGELLAAIGRYDLERLAASELTLARQFAAACLHAIRRNRNTRRMFA